MSVLKNGGHKELGEILSNKDRFITPFSTAHIGDLFSSFDRSEKQQAYINSDLEFISNFTEERCLYNEPERIVIEYYPPKELFDQRIESSQLLKGIPTLGFSSLFDGLDITQESLHTIKSMLDSIPMNPILEEMLDDPEKAKEVEKLFPGLKENPTFEGTLNGIMAMIQGLNDTESYKDLRQTVQSGFNINRDRIYDTDDPFEMINKEYDKAGVKKPDHLENSKQAPAWYNKICNEYLLLDMHGYQEDKINIEKGRKETFKNTTEDAFHCAYATTCNFYITSDNRTYKKSKKLYEEFGLQTTVLKPDGFVEYYKNCLDVEDKGIDILLINEVLKRFGYYEEDKTDFKLRIYIIPYFLFDFFNKIMVSVSNMGEIESIILSRNNPTHNFILPVEIEKVIARLNLSFGADDDNLGELQDNELDDDLFKERTWSRDEISWKLTRLNGHFQLYFHLPKPENASFKTPRIRENIFLKGFSHLASIIKSWWNRFFIRISQRKDRG